MVEPEINVENISQALHQLYNGSDQTRDAAQVWLSKTQRSEKAWQFSWDLLKPEQPTEVQFYGASALISRIQNGFPGEVPEKDIPILREHMLQLLLRFSTDTSRKVVFTRVCVAFSHFIFKCVVNNLWPNAITELISMFKSAQGECGSTLTDEQRCLALLNLLTILPEEHHTNKTDTHNLGTIMYMLRSEFPNVHQCLQAINQQKSGGEMKIKMIQCLRAWLAIGISIIDCRDTLLTVASYIHDSELFESSVECLICAFSSPTVYTYPNTVKSFVPIILSLRPMLVQAIVNEEGETFHLLTRLICSLAENQTKLVLNTLTDPKLGAGLIELVMDCTKVPLQYPITEYSSPITYTFWYALQDDMFTVPQDELAEIQKTLYPIYCTLAHEILNKAYYPKEDVLKGFSADESEQFRIFRVDISDTLMYIFNFLGVELITYTFNRFTSALTQRNEQPDPERPWQEVEACLYGIHSLLETVSEYSIDLPMLPSFATTLPKVAVDSDYLAETLLYTIGTMVEWLNLRPEYLQPLVAIVLPYLLHKELTLQCVLTLKRLTSECGCYMISYAGEIMNQLTTVLVRGVLRPLEEGSLMQCAGYVLSEMPIDECMKSLENLLMLKIHQLKALAGEEPSAPNKSTIVGTLGLLSNLFQTLHVRGSDDDEQQQQEKIEPEQQQPEQPAVLILKQLVDVFKEILNRWASDEEIVKNLCSLYDRSVRNLLTKSRSILVDMCSMMALVYENHPHPHILDLAQRIMTIFADSDVDVVGEFTQRLIRATLLLYENRYYIQNPDVSQYFLRFMSMLVRKQPRLLRYRNKMYPQHASMSDIFHCSMLTLNLLDSESVKTSSAFFSDFLNLCAKDDEVKAAVMNSGRELLTASLRAIGGVGPRSCNQKFADILFSIASHCHHDYLKWMAEMESRHDIPCINIDATSKSRFMHALRTDLKHKRKFRDNVENLSLSCRGMLGTEYGRATSL